MDTFHPSHELIEKSGKGLECVACLLCTCHSAPELKLYCEAFFIEKKSA